MSVMSATFMIAIEATIVSTAMPQIAGQLGDLHLYSWVFSAFLLTQTVSTVVFGRLADLYGRKPVILTGIGIFLAGSVLCGLAWSMPSLILFRLVQGLGAGAIQPVALTIVGDLYPGAERGKVQGYLASVWGVSSVFGPLAGGLIIQHLSWAWIFWINIPIGLGSAFGFARFLHERVAPHQDRADLPGAALFAVTISALMIALTELGTASHGIAFAACGVFVIGAVLFVWQERRTRNPMVNFAMWSRRLIATANATTLFSGMVVIGLTTFLPMYVQGVLGKSPLVAGFALTMMVLGWPIGATLAARGLYSLGMRRVLLLGAALVPVGASAFLVLGPDTSPVLAGIGSFTVGLGMGLLSTASIVLIQGSVDWAERGAATSSNVFSRNLGSTLGATVLGAVLNISLSAADIPVGSDQMRALLDHGAAAIGNVATRAALSHALHLTFWAVFGVAVLTLLLALLVPSAKPKVLQPASAAD
jgi:MFS family permease